jgi:hypothetical protein
MQEITLETIIGLHDTILAKDGGDLRIISEANLHQLVFQVNLKEDPVARAATAFWSLCAYPAFREGNRRTAYRLAEVLRAGGIAQKELPCEEMRALAKGIDSFIVEIDDVVRVLQRQEEQTS